MAQTGSTGATEAVAAIVEAAAAAAASLLVHTWMCALLALLAVVAGALLRNYRYHGLNQYPGPAVAAVTDAWRFCSVARGRAQMELRELHAQYGDVVRLGPNALSFSTPAARRAIYGLAPKLAKSGFYPVQMQVSRGVVLQSLFGTQDLAYHARLRRTVSGAFTMTAMLQYEARVNETVRAFLRQTDALYAATGAACNFVLWLQFFAFDVVTEITYSRRVGFIDTNTDVDGIIQWLADIFDYQAPVGQMPWLDRLLVKNPVRMLLSRYGLLDNSSGTARFSRARMEERLGGWDKTAEREASKDAGDEADDSKAGDGTSPAMDLLTMFLRAQRDDPGFFDNGRMLTMTTSLALAGSDTTAASLAAVFYHLLRNPPCLRRLLAEVDAAATAEPGLFTYAEAQQLPFLHAVIQETFRMHPAIGMVLERLTPPEGLEIDGRFVPGGTVVGCNPWVLHARRDVFGDAPLDFRPERWLADPARDPAGEQARLRAMAGELFHFGGGNRTCLGKHIALLEMYKLVPTFLRHFEVRPTTDAPWDLHLAWFVKPKTFDVTIVRRAGAARV